jgi:hypothetical protein
MNNKITPEVARDLLSDKMNSRLISFRLQYLMLKDPDWLVRLAETEMKCERTEDAIAVLVDNRMNHLYKK